MSRCGPRLFLRIFYSVKANRPVSASVIIICNELIGSHPEGSEGDKDMKSTKCLIASGVLAALALACFAGEKPVLTQNDQTQALVEGNNRFALELYAKLRDAEGNLFLSPYSISTALAMTYAGAENATAAQMANVLRFPIERSKDLDSNKQGELSDSIKKKLMSREHLAAAFGKLQKSVLADPKEKGCELSVANALWGQKGCRFKQQFIDLVRTDYDGRFSELDFVAAAESARKTINAWVEKKTKNKIKELIKPGMLNSMTRLVLTNAIYFKGAWAEQFEEAMTQPGTFNLADGKKIEVPMMNQTDKFKYAETDTLQLLDLPYAGDDLSMTILLPKKEFPLSDFEKTLTAKSLLPLLTKLYERKVIVSIPKFKITSEFSMASVLKSMGMTDAFTPGAADFSGINGGKDLFISAVVHKAFVEVNEEGTEAAAATAVGISTTSMPIDSPPIFRADRPFLFLIRQNKTAGILFIGRVANPKT